MGPTGPTKKPLHGFTLLETVIYIAIMGAVLTSAAVVTNTVFDNRARIEGRLLVRDHAAFAIRRMRSHVQQAADVTTPALGQPTSTLVLVMNDASLNPTTVTLQNGSVMMQRGAGAMLPLTSQEVRVTSLLFTRLSGTPPSLQVQISAQTRATTSTVPVQNFLETFSLHR